MMLAYFTETKSELKINLPEARQSNDACVSPRSEASALGC